MFRIVCTASALFLIAAVSAAAFADTDGTEPADQYDQEMYDADGGQGESDPVGGVVPPEERLPTVEEIQRFIDEIRATGLNVDLGYYMEYLDDCDDQADRMAEALRQRLWESVLTADVSTIAVYFDDGSGHRTVFVNTQSGLIYVDYACIFQGDTVDDLNDQLGDRYRADVIVTTRVSGDDIHDAASYPASFMTDIGACLDECVRRRDEMLASDGLQPDENGDIYYDVMVVELYYQECESACLAAQGDS